MYNKQPFLLIFPCSHLGDSCLKGKWPQLRLEVPPAYSPVDGAANLMTLHSWLEMIRLRWIAVLGWPSWACYRPLNAA